MGKAELKIEIDADLLAQARAAGLVFEDLIEDGLRKALRNPGLSDDEKARQWAEENVEAIKAQRERIDAVGVFGEDLRTW